MPFGKVIFQIQSIDRAIVKAWITSTQRFTKFHQIWPQLALKTLEKGGFKMSNLLFCPSLTEPILGRFPVQRDWADCRIRWSQLMFEENKAIIETMELLRSKAIPVLPFHDSLVVPSASAETTHKILKRVLES